ncbi:MAG: hypothetical protein J6M17_00690 [Ruminococcus sp.]|nr:hypothetical protein [Ruminococcus sp.]
MFNEPGKKLKALAKVFFVLSILVGIIATLIVYAAVQNGAVFLLIPVSIVGSWLSTIALYAFGELCDNTAEIRRSLNK